jgi:hypothetical protein
VPRVASEKKEADKPQGFRGSIGLELGARNLIVFIYADLALNS